MRPHGLLLVLTAIGMPMPVADAMAQTIVAAPPVATGAPLDLTLVDAVALGLRANWTVRSLYVQRIAQRYDLWVSEQRFVPRVQAIGGVEYDRGGGVSSRFETVGATASWLTPTGATVDFAWTANSRSSDGIPGFAQTRSVSILQPLLRGGGLSINAIPIRIARLQDDVNRLSLRNSVASIITSIVTTYRALIQARDQVNVAQASLARSRQQLAVNRTLVDVGRMAAADLVQNEADIASQELALLQTQRGADAARLALLRILALDLHTRIGNLDMLRPERVTLDADRLAIIAKAHRVDLLSQEKNVEQARLALATARNDRLWDLSAVGSYNRNAIPGGNAGNLIGGRTTASAVGLRLTVPLVDPGRAQAEVGATTALKSAELQLDDINQQVEQDVRDNAAQVDSNWLQLEAANRAYELATQALAVVRKKLQVGRSSNFEVVAYEANLRSAETQRLSATINYLNGLTLLDLQLGTTTDTWRIELND